MSAIGRQAKTTPSIRGGRTLAVLVTLLVLGVCSVAGLWAAPAQAATTALSSEELEFLSLMNDYRVANGVAPLLISDKLMLSADRHSSDMAKYWFFDHKTKKSDWFTVGSYPWDRMKKCGYSYYTYMGENIAAGQITAQWVFDDFKYSTMGHNEAMLNPSYKVVGVSQVFRSGSQYEYYWTIDFGGYIDPTAHDPAMFQQNDSRLTRLGSWAGVYRSSASYGNFVTAKSRGDAILAGFTGATIEVVAEMGPQYGRAKISVDGNAPEVVNLYSPTTLPQQTVWRSGSPLDETVPHTLLIEWDYENNSAGQLISVDALRVLKADGDPGDLTQAPLPKRHEQDNPAIRYVGPWATSWSGSASNGSFAYAGAPGAAVSVKFTGTYLSWIAKKNPYYGKARVSLDGSAPVTVDLYSPYSTFKQSVYGTGFLEDTEHTLSIYWDDKARKINVDAFDVFGADFAEVDLTAALDDPVPINWLYENTDSRIGYLGPWTTGFTSLASGGSHKYSCIKGAVAVVKFTGTSIELLGRTGPAYSTALISLDGAGPELVDLHGDTNEFKSIYSNPSPLEYKEHTLTIQATGYDATSGGYALSIDALKITGTMTEAAKTTRVQQTNPMFAYEGRWATRYISAASYGSFKYANSPGAAVTVTFDGTFFAWVAKVGPTYGRALVSVDDGEPTTVSLYSSRNAYKRQVFATGLLDPGTHHVTIRWSEDNAAGRYISVDAADIVIVTR